MDINNPFICDPILKTYLEKSMHGNMQFTLMNDFLSKYSFQKDGYALKGFVAACLKISIDEILDIEVCNPIEIGDFIDDKTCILDLKIFMNHSKIINIEIQTSFQDFWPERSLTYLCKNFDHLKAGDSYKNIKECLHIGILKKGAFAKDDSRYLDKLYSEYKLLEISTYTEYTNKFGIKIVSLNHIEKATEEEKVDINGIYNWARLFTAQTWEEFMEVAVKNPMMESLACTVKMLTKEEKIAQMAEAREKYERDVLTWKEELNEAHEKLAQMAEARERYERDMLTRKEELNEAQEKLAAKQEEIADLKRQIAELKSQGHSS